MKNTILFVLFSICLMATLASCKKTETVAAYVDKPIVESYLSNGDTLSVKVTRQTAFKAGSGVTSDDDINNLKLYVSYNGMTSLLTPKGGGVYKAIAPLVVVGANMQYDLKFLFNRDTVRASTTVPTRPTGYTQSVTQMKIQQVSATTMTQPTFPDALKLKWINNNAGYYVVVIENIATNKVLIFDFGGNGPPDSVFRGKPERASSYEVQPLQFKYYGMHRLILYHLNPDYASLYDDSGSSSLNLTSPATSIANGLGIFTGIGSDTLMINVIKP
jgi:Domain of unknown function (DUF4249)